MLSIFGVLKLSTALVPGQIGALNLMLYNLITQLPNQDQEKFFGIYLETSSMLTNVRIYVTQVHPFIFSDGVIVVPETQDFGRSILPVVQCLFKVIAFT